MNLDTAAQTPAPVSAPDFSAFSVEELQGAITSGNLENLTPPVVTDSTTTAEPVADPPVSATPTGASEPAATPPVDAIEPPATSEAAEKAEAVPAAADPEKPEEAAEPVVTFQFTPDADDETFIKEKAKWEEAYEADPATRFLIDRQDKMITDLRTQMATAQPHQEEVPQLYTQAVEALDALVSRVRDPHDNRPVPNTAPLVNFLQTSFPQELPDLAESFLAMPSPKYQGITLFQQYLRDYGNLDEQGLMTVQQVLDNGGKLPIPSYVPPGIDPRVADAFWHAPDRQAVLEAVEANYEVLQDPLATPEDKAVARNYINQVNQNLNRVQYGIDAQINARQADIERNVQQRVQVEQAGDQAYTETSAALTRSFAERLAENLDMFDPTAARVTALAYGNLIVNALADDAWAPYAQADLAKEGIQFNWNEGKKALERLRNAEHNIAGHVATKASPAAVEIAKKEKAAAIKEVKRLELDLLGRISKVAVLGASRVLEGKVAAAPKTPAATPRVVAAAAGSANPVASTDNGLEAYDTMSVEELQSRIGKLKAEGGIF